MSSTGCSLSFGQGLAGIGCCPSFSGKVWLIVLRGMYRANMHEVEKRTAKCCNSPEVNLGVKKRA